MRKEYTIKNGLIGFVSQFLNLILGFVLRAYFIKVLSQEFLGLNGLFQDLLSIISITELGIGSAVTFALYKPIYENDKSKIIGLYRFYKKAYRIIGIIIFFISLSLTPWIQIFIKDFTLDIQFIRFIFMLFVINTCLNYFLGYSRVILFAHQKNYVVTLTDLAFKIILIFLQILILVFTKNYVFYLLIMIAYTVIDNLVINQITNRNYPYLKNIKVDLDPEYRMQVLTNLKYLSLSSLISIGVLGTDRIIISSIIGIGVLGIYSNYALIIQQVQNLFINLLNGVVASFGNLIAEKNTLKIQEIYYVYSFAYFLIASFSSVAFYILLTPFISQIWLNANYAIEQSLIVVVVFNSYLFLSRQPVWQLQNTAGIFKHYIPFSIIEFIINLSVSIYGGYRWGLIGVFLGSTSAYLISWTGQMFILNKHVIMDKFSKILIRQILYLFVMMSEVFITFTILEMVQVNNAWLMFVVKGLLIFLITSLMNTVFFYKTHEYQYLFDFFSPKLAQLIKKFNHQ